MSDLITSQLRYEFKILLVKYLTNIVWFNDWSSNKQTQNTLSNIGKTKWLIYLLVNSKKPK